ncbi:hypothetical protein ASF21_12795 [Arthrobacter sp. Leaf234]|nr:hypothetical protein ASF21_12795 [Arthrobacter sp. Leaf234]
MTRKTWHLRQADRLEEAGATNIAEGFRMSEDMLDERFKKDEGEPPKFHRMYINLIDAVIINGESTRTFDSLRIDMRKIIGWDLAQMRAEG